MSRGVRVYLPVTPAGLGSLAAGEPLTGPAFAVTDRLRAAFDRDGADGTPEPREAGDLADELAEAALRAAADAALELLAANPGVPPRRGVVAADVPAAAVPAGPGVDPVHPATVVPSRPVRRADVASVMLDDDAAGPAVAAAVAALRAGDDAAVETARDALDGHALSWYDASELDGLVAFGRTVPPGGTPDDPLGDRPDDPTGAPPGDPTPTRDRTEGQHP
jgi:hypothetical protein